MNSVATTIEKLKERLDELLTVEDEIQQFFLEKVINLEFSLRAAILARKVAQKKTNFAIQGDKSCQSSGYLVVDDTLKLNEEKAAGGEDLRNNSQEYENKKINRYTVADDRSAQMKIEAFDKNDKNGIEVVDDFVPVNEENLEKQTNDQQLKSGSNEKDNQVDKESLYQERTKPNKYVQEDTQILDDGEATKKVNLAKQLKDLQLENEPEKKDNPVKDTKWNLVGDYDSKQGYDSNFVDHYGQLQSQNGCKEGKFENSTNQVQVVSLRDGDFNKACSSTIGNDSFTSVGGQVHPLKNPNNNLYFNKSNEAESKIANSFQVAYNQVYTETTSNKQYFSNIQVPPTTFCADSNCQNHFLSEAQIQHLKPATPQQNKFETAQSTSLRSFRESTNQQRKEVGFDSYKQTNPQTHSPYLQENLSQDRSRQGFDLKINYQKSRGSCGTVDSDLIQENLDRYVSQCDAQKSSQIQNVYKQRDVNFCCDSVQASIYEELRKSTPTKQENMASLSGTEIASSNFSGEKWNDVDEQVLLVNVQNALSVPTQLEPLQAPSFQIYGGTRDVPYTSILKGIYPIQEQFVSITAMEVYQNKSFEELRLEDYQYVKI